MVEQCARVAAGAGVNAGYGLSGDYSAKFGEGDVCRDESDACPVDRLPNSRERAVLTLRIGLT